MWVLELSEGQGASGCNGGGVEVFDWGGGGDKAEMRRSQAASVRSVM
jgi:hypothetical protein